MLAEKQMDNAKNKYPCLAYFLVFGEVIHSSSKSSAMRLS
jgi:hypothetical protein